MTYSWHAYIIALTLASHGHRDVNIYPQFTVHGKQKVNLETSHAKVITLVLKLNFTCQNLCPLHTHTSSMCLCTQRIPGRQV